jgi:hypothetical protein
MDRFDTHVDHDDRVECLQITSLHAAKPRCCKSIADIVSGTIITKEHLYNGSCIAV